MLRASHLPPLAYPALTLSALRISLIPTFNLSSSPSNLQKVSTFSLSHRFLHQTFKPFSRQPSSLSLKRILHLPMEASFSAGATAGNSSETGKEILVQHLLVKEDDLKLLLELQQRISGGEDLSDLAVEYSICPSKEEGGMLGWVRKGQMVPEFEEAAFSAPLNSVVRCKTKFGWHLLQVLSEREESVLQDIQPEELHQRMQDPSFLDEAQLIDVREPEEVAKASLPSFQVLPLRQFGSWGPEITTKFDPQKDTYVMCHHGMRSLQVAKWLQSQGFQKVFNVSGGIHAYSVKVDQSIPTY
ncbi:rhodanese-like/PpiC domain-containing protein 12, chloroplastic isoform X2 [Ziziphus jujuba]|uniref:Rhodanese-like/PpiC domain-containing protein 12, chloroplastic isoform X2 n=2 Tax=Ziziphus jujuba TaxID=326968 RepID=A0A6P3ZJ52_ZIZJJ|nr:rhodanese-like/PpiC domain-containing protein 12, chloroplastic isoform X2 [Ziziphus jujuba]KAH7542180.1 hypothetical protein FEM48_Zijuj02G0045800 [Ziziphus jujuba var. spinosa]